MQDPNEKCTSWPPSGPQRSLDTYVWPPLEWSRPRGRYTIGKAGGTPRKFSTGFAGGWPGFCFTSQIAEALA